MYNEFAVSNAVAKKEAFEITVRPPRADEARQVEVLLENAFRNNPIVSLMFGGLPRAGRLKLLNRWMVKAPRVETRLAAAGDRILGAMKYADHPYCETRGWASVRFAFDCARAWGWRSLVNIPILKFGDAHPKWHHRHLMIIGVAPDWAGRGVGSRLLSHFLEDADADQVTAMLETDTPRAKALYERFGFRVFKEQNIRKLKFWYMKREAGQNGATARSD